MTPSQSTPPSALQRASALANSLLNSGSSYPIIVHCHLRWDFVWQRPQQFLSRISKKHRVLFVEGPLVEEGNFEPRYTLHEAEKYPSVTIMQTHFPSERWGDGAWVDSERRRVLCEALAGPLKGQFENSVQWFYDPMAVTAFAGMMDEQAIVYDCMDELSQFKFAPPELIQRERQLLAMADVVFAGGRKMHESKSRHNANAYFYGCGVDVDHFAKALSKDTPIPADIAHLEGPVLGYFGVVDERLDYELIAKIADARPDWNVVMVGPTAKVDPADLPQRPNLHWMGGRDYKELPAYTKRFDVCLMPFALNEATEYINPTKALEYMATASPIVSSEVPDVVSNFGSVVKIAHSHDAFIWLCQAALEYPDRVNIERGVRMAKDNTWDAIVAKLEGHIDDAIAHKNREEFAESRERATKKVAAAVSAA